MLAVCAVIGCGSNTGAADTAVSVNQDSTITEVEDAEAGNVSKNRKRHLFHI